MPITQVPQYAGDIPVIGQNQPTFNQNTADIFDYIGSVSTSINDVAGEINDTATQVNNNAATASTKADEAAASASEASAFAAGINNFQGDFSVGVTSADVGETYRYENRYWTCIVATTSTPAFGNTSWREVVGKADIDAAEERAIGIGVSIYRGSNGQYVQNGNEIPAGATHISLLINGKAEDLAAWDELILPAVITTTPTTNNGFSGYDVVTDQGTFEFVTQETYRLRKEFRPEGWGAKDDIADDATYDALQYIANNLNGWKLTSNKTYNLNGNTLNIPSGFVWQSDLSCVLKNGSLECYGASYANNIIGDCTFTNCDTRIGGTSSSTGTENHCTGFKIGKMVSDEIFRLQYMKDFSVDSVRVDIPESKDSATQRAMGWTALEDGEIDSIHLSGYYAMGFETSGNGSIDNVYNAKNVHVNSIISDRNPLASGSAGLHGVYLHGGFNLTVDALYSVGYALADQGVSNDFKFRDNHNCKINKLTCLTAQISSDANSTTLNSLKDNVLNDVSLAPDPDDIANVGKLTATVTGSGFFSKNVINNFHGELGTSGTLTTDGNEAIKLIGNITFVKDGNLQLSNVVFESAFVKWGEADTNYYTRALVAYNTKFEDIVRIQNDLKTYGCNLKGGVRLETLGSARTLVHNNSVIESDWDTVLSTGSVDADMCNTDIKVPRPGATLRPNGILRYRFVSFDNGYYIATSSDGDFVNI